MIIKNQILDKINLIKLWVILIRYNILEIKNITKNLIFKPNNIIVHFIF